MAKTALKPTITLADSGKTIIIDTTAEIYRMILYNTDDIQIGWLGMGTNFTVKLVDAPRAITGLTFRCSMGSTIADISDWTTADEFDWTNILIENGSPVVGYTIKVSKDSAPMSMIYSNQTGTAPTFTGDGAWVISPTERYTEEGGTIIPDNYVVSRIYKDTGVFECIKAVESGFKLDQSTTGVSSKWSGRMVSNTEIRFNNGYSLKSVGFSFSTGVIISLQNMSAQVFIQFTTPGSIGSTFSGYLQNQQLNPEYTNSIWVILYNKNETVSNKSIQLFDSKNTLVTTFTADSNPTSGTTSFETTVAFQLTPELKQVPNQVPSISRQGTATFGKIVETGSDLLNLYTIIDTTKDNYTTYPTSPIDYGLSMRNSSNSVVSGLWDYDIDFYTTYQAVNGIIVKWDSQNKKFVKGEKWGALDEMIPISSLFVHNAPQTVTRVYQYTRNSSGGPGISGPYNRVEGSDEFAAPSLAAPVAFYARNTANPSISKDGVLTCAKLVEGSYLTDKVSSWTQLSTSTDTLLQFESGFSLSCDSSASLNGAVNIVLSSKNSDETYSGVISISKTQLYCYIYDINNWISSEDIYIDQLSVSNGPGGPTSDITITNVDGKTYTYTNIDGIRWKYEPIDDNNRLVLTPAQRYQYYLYNQDMLIPTGGGSNMIKTSNGGFKINFRRTSSPASTYYPTDKTVNLGIKNIGSPGVSVSPFTINFNSSSLVSVTLNDTFEDIWRLENLVINQLSYNFDSPNTTFEADLILVDSSGNELNTVTFSGSGISATNTDGFEIPLSMRYGDGRGAIKDLTPQEFGEKCIQFTLPTSKPITNDNTLAIYAWTNTGVTIQSLCNENGLQMHLLTNVSTPSSGINTSVDSVLQIDSIKKSDATNKVYTYTGAPSLWSSNEDHEINYIVTVPYQASTLGSNQKLYITTKNKTYIYVYDSTQGFTQWWKPQGDKLVITKEMRQEIS